MHGNASGTTDDLRGDPLPDLDWGISKLLDSFGLTDVLDWMRNDGNAS